MQTYHSKAPSPYHPIARRDFLAHAPCLIASAALLSSIGQINLVLTGLAPEALQPTITTIGIIQVAAFLTLGYEFLRAARPTPGTQRQTDLRSVYRRHRFGTAFCLSIGAILPIALAIAF